MRAAHRPPLSPRPGLTLVELLVVIAIVAGLAALTVLLFPRLQDSQQVSKGADKVQGQLYLSKQLALRDQLPRGVRFLSSQGTNLFDTLQLIEQPAPYTVGVVTGVGQQATANLGWAVTFGGDPITGAAPGSDFSTSILPGDLLDLTAAGDSYCIPGAGATPALHLVASVVNPSATNPATVYLATQPQVSATGAPPPWPYRILRSPRPLTGEAPVSMPTNIIVDGAQSLITPDAFTGTYDVLFDPSGKVLRSAGTQGKVVLWVRDNSGNNFAADQTLIAVYTRTGAIIAQPVAAGANPYAYVQDGATSGM